MPCLCHAQIIKSISIDMSYNDAAWRLLKVDDGFVVLLGSVCFDNTVGVRCSGVIKLDKSLNVEWKRVLNWLDPWQTCMIAQKDSSIYVFGRPNKPDTNNMYILQLNNSGDSIACHGFNLPKNYPSGLALTENGSFALLLNEVIGTNPIETRLNISMLDDAWQVVSKTQYLDKFKVVEVPVFKSTPDGGFIISGGAYLYPDGFWIMGAAARRVERGKECGCALFGDFLGWEEIRAGVNARKDGAEAEKIEHVIDAIIIAPAFCRRPRLGLGFGSKAKHGDSYV